MNSRNHLHQSPRGSALVIALLFAGVIIAIGATSFTVINNKYVTVHQAASWQEALLTADAGVDMALTEIRKQLWAPTEAWNNWTLDGSAETPATSAALATGTTAVYRTSDVIVRDRGEGASESYAIVTVDAPPNLKDGTGEQWYRIRSTGICGLPSGGSIRGRALGGEKSDARLRKFDVRFDRFDSTNTLTEPRASRRIEAIAKPQGAFRTALFGVETINMNNHNIEVDSYDSRDSEKSTNDFYDPSKRQWHGDIATNGQVINAGSAHIYGTASTNGGTVLNGDNVTGNYPDDPDAIRNDYYQEVVTVIPPSISTGTAGTPTTINGSEQIAASPGAPTNVIVSGINLSGQDVLRITGAADGSPTYAQFIVSGNISLSGRAEIILDPGVHVRMFVQGDADITGNGVSNPNSPLHFQYYGLDRPANSDGTEDIGKIKIAGNGGFRGTVYAPNYNVEMVGGGNSDSIYGSFVGNIIRMTGVQSVHYDEALADGGLVTGYNIVSWFEDER